MAVEQGLRSRFIRTFGFVKKELLTVIRQPRLILMLVVGPFLILLIFGIGYRDTPPPFRTLIILEGEEAGLASDLDDLGQSFDAGIELVGTSTDPDEGYERLESGDIDLLIIAPENAVDSLENNERANFTIIHTQVDPVLRGSIELLSRLSVDEMNRRVVANVVDQAQAESEDFNNPISQLRESAGRLSGALESGDEAGARDARLELQQGLDTARESESSRGVIDGVSEALGLQTADQFDEIDSQIAATGEDDPAAPQNARELEATLADLEEQLERAQSIDSQLLVSPFGTNVELLTDLSPEPAIFYAPGVLILLVQHLAVTFAALSLVRERELGLTEVFRVSPLAVSEALIGKYIAFSVITGVVAATLAATMLAFGVPLLGSMAAFVTVVVLVILASLGLGFVISGISKTDSQAIQYSMIVLLVSIFFTGFVLPLDQLITQVRVLSLAIPGTYGISALHDVMFRGIGYEPLLIGGLGLYALVMGVLAWLVTRKDVVIR